MQWYYADAGRQIGPLEDAAFEDLVRNGTVRDDTPVWKEGMANWQPYSTVRPPRPAPPPPAPAPPPPVVAPVAPAAPETGFCTQCGGRFPVPQLALVGNRQMCPACRQAAQPAAPQVPQPTAPTPQYAQPQYSQPQQPQYQQQPGGYTPPPAAATPINPNAAGITPFGAETATWANRAIGYLIDSIFVVIAMILLGVIASVVGIGTAGLGALGNINDPGAAMAASGLSSGICCFLFALFPISILGVGMYNKVYLISKRGSSIGQGMMKIKIVDQNGNLLTFGSAFIRLLAQIGIGLIPLGSLLDLLWPLWDDKRQTLHDKAVGSFAINNPSGR